MKVLVAQKKQQFFLKYQIWEDCDFTRFAIPHWCDSELIQSVWKIIWQYLLRLNHMIL